MDHFIEYIDDSGENIRRKLDIDRMPVVGRYVKNPPLDLKLHGFSKRPFFPSNNPLFDFASPEDVRSMKKLVEKQIDQEFDYRICQRLYNQMKADDEEPQSHQQHPPSFYFQPIGRKQGIIGRVGDLFRRRHFSHTRYLIQAGGQAEGRCPSAAGRGHGLGLAVSSHGVRRICRLKGRAP